MCEGADGVNDTNRNFRRARAISIDQIRIDQIHVNMLCVCVCPQHESVVSLLHSEDSYSDICFFSFCGVGKGLLIANFLSEGSDKVLSSLLLFHVVSVEWC